MLPIQKMRRFHDCGSTSVKCRLSIELTIASFIFISLLQSHLCNSFTAPVLQRQSPSKPIFPSLELHESSSLIKDAEQQSSYKIDSTALIGLKQCTSGTAARRLLENVLLSDEEREIGALYQSVRIPKGASDRPLSDADLAIQTNIRNAKYSIMELIELNGDRDADRASLAVFCLTVASSVSAIVANQSMSFGPEILRFVVVWLFSFAPLAFVGYGLSTPAELQALLVSIQRNVFPTYRKRMIQHEAGHFLIGHLLGMPIRGYSANAVKNSVEFYPLNDSDVGKERASQLGFDRPTNNDSGTYYDDTPKQTKGYFSNEGSGSQMLQDQSVFRRTSKEDKYADFVKLPAQDEPKNAWPYRGFDHATLDQLTAVSVAGVCAEILAFGNAEGGYADLSKLRQLLSNAEPQLSEKEMENRIRYALGFAMGQLRRHLGALDALAKVMEQDGDVAECVLAIENCKNPSGASLVSNYERIRRNAFREEGVSIVERLFLGAGRNVDTEDNRIVEGKGGGDRLPKFELTGDDPFYVALAVAGIFFLWASAGGLTLH